MLPPFLSYRMFGVGGTEAIIVPQEPDRVVTVAARH
jgi:hypothetical protein